MSPSVLWIYWPYILYVEEVGLKSAQLCMLLFGLGFQVCDTYYCV